MSSMHVNVLTDAAISNRLLKQNVRFQVAAEFSINLGYDLLNTILFISAVHLVFLAIQVSLGIVAATQVSVTH